MLGSHQQSSRGNNALQTLLATLTSPTLVPEIAHCCPLTSSLICGGFVHKHINTQILSTCQAFIWYHFDYVINRSCCHRKRPSLGRHIFCQLCGFQMLTQVEIEEGEGRGGGSSLPSIIVLSHGVCYNGFTTLTYHSCYIGHSSQPIPKHPIHHTLNSIGHHTQLKTSLGADYIKSRL